MTKQMQVNSCFPPGTIRWLDIYPDKIVITFYDGGEKQEYKKLNTSHVVDKVSVSESALGG